MISLGNSELELGKKFKRISLVVVLLSFYCSNSAFATSRIPLPNPQAQSANGGNAQPYCEMRARFEKPTHQAETIVTPERTYQEQKVGWEFLILSSQSISGGPCPQGPHFMLSIRGADYVRHPEGTEEYVYPMYVQPLKKDEEVLLRIRLVQGKDPRTGKAFEEWLVINWEHGILQQK